MLMLSSSWCPSRRNMSKKGRKLTKASTTSAVSHAHPCRTRLLLRVRTKGPGVGKNPTFPPLPLRPPFFFFYYIVYYTRRAATGIRIAPPVRRWRCEAIPHRATLSRVKSVRVALLFADRPSAAAALRKRKRFRESERRKEVAISHHSSLEI